MCLFTPFSPLLMLISPTPQTNSQTAKQWFINGVAWNKQAYHDIDLSGTSWRLRVWKRGVYSSTAKQPNLTKQPLICVNFYMIARNARISHT